MSCFPLGNELATNDENGGSQPSVVGGLFSEEERNMRAARKATNIALRTRP
jgi:hypothetical protein